MPTANPTTHRVIRAALAMLALGGTGFGFGEPVRYGVGSPWLTVVDDVIVFDGVDPSIGFDPARGWFNFAGPAPERTEAGGVTVERATLIGLDIARTNGLRTTTRSNGRRYVLEVAGRLPPNFQQARAIATVVPGDPWRWQLPGVAAPLSPNGERADALTIASDPLAGGLSVHYTAAEAVKIHAFTLTEPGRLVIDVSELPRDARIPEQTQDTVQRAIWPGVTAVERAVSTAAAHSRVHEVLLAPGARLMTDLRAAEGVALPVDGAVANAVAAINTGYYDPSTLAPIGLRIVDGEVRALPSRGRPVLYSDAAGLGITTPSGLIELWSGTELLEQARIGQTRSFDVAWAEGVTFGTAAGGIIRVDASGVVLSNQTGYDTVPAGGMAVRYNPFMASLARLQPGDRLRTEIVLDAPLNKARWAVEAGPSLIRDGRDAYEPASERFQDGTRIVSDVTQQAAIALHADGRVRLIAAERMTAADLVPYLLELGVEDAIRLDSGGSTTLVAGGRPLNRSSRRDVESVLVVLDPSLGDAAR